MVLKRVVLLAAVSGLAMGGVIVHALAQPKPTKITTANIPAHLLAGKVIIGHNAATAPAHLQAADKLVYQSAEIKSPKPRSNAAILKWDQTGGPGGVTPSFRINDGHEWSDWVGADDGEDRKDGSLPSHAALVLSTHIKKIQYRFEMANTGGTPPDVNLDTTNIELVDSTQGPSPTKKSLFEKTMQRLGIIGTASAHADGPHIISRAEWGSPQPDSSPAWDLEYRKLDRAIVHHTVTAFTPDSAAAIRAIWQYHTYTQGWGDIGYNYIVDPAGNIFQGRYYDKAVAETQRVDVVAGHAYGWNYGTTGIAALGDFSKVRPGETMLKAIGDIIAFKLHRYDRDPAGWYGDWPVVMGHRDVGQTSCPGSVHLDLPSIRTFAAQQIWHYRLVDHFDALPVSQGLNGVPGSVINLVAGDTANAYFDFRNVGIDTWTPAGPPIRLGADRPRDRPSQIADDWISPNRAAAATYRVTSYSPDGSGNLDPETSILPGAVGRFIFPIKAPEAPGSYLEQFQLVADGNSWFIRDFNVSLRVNVAPRSYTWQAVQQSLYTDDTKTSMANPAHLAPGDHVFAVVRAKNTGNQTWTNSGSNPTRFGTYRAADRASAFCDPSWGTGCDRPSNLEEASVSPGATGTFEFWFTAPSVSHDQTYDEFFNLVTEGRAWMGDLGLNWEFTVDAP